MTRLLLAVLLLSMPLTARAVEPWADSKLPVTDGLHLCLDASRIEAAAKAEKETLPSDGMLAVWFDGSGNGRHVRQPVVERQPTIVKAGEVAVVRFDGDDDRLRLTGGKDELQNLTLFIVVAPRRN